MGCDCIIPAHCFSIYFVTMYMYVVSHAKNTTVLYGKVRNKTQFHPDIFGLYRV